MSSFTESWGRKLKGKSSTSSSSSTTTSSYSSSRSGKEPIFRFSKGDEDLLEIIDEPLERSVCPNTNNTFKSIAKPCGKSEAILVDPLEFQNEDEGEEASSKIIEISAPSTFSLSEVTPSSSSASSLAESPSFLHAFKRNIRDKFKSDKGGQSKSSLGKPLNTPNNFNSASSLDLSLNDPSVEESLFDTKTSISSSEPINVDSKLTHSLSEQFLSSVPNAHRSENENPLQSKEEGDEDVKTPTDPPPQEDVISPKDTMRRSKFHFSFRSSPNKTHPQAVPPLVKSDLEGETHRGSSSAIFQKIIGLGSQKPATNSPVSMKQLEEPLEINTEQDEQFTELVPEEEDAIERGIEADELMNLSDFPPNYTPLTFPLKPPKPETLPLDSSDLNGSRPFLSKVQLYSILPIIIVLLVQILPVPNWVTGFITGVLISVPTAFYLSVKLFQDSETLVSPTDPKEFLVNAKTISPRFSCPIFIDEEIKRKSVWMNIWPSKYGVYDPMTYDVRWTVSVLVELYGYWIEMRFPRKNIPLRRMHNETEIDLDSMNFFEHQVIDLTTADICLMPDNLPAKWMWSKKYPIQIKTYSKKQSSSEGGDSSSPKDENKGNGKLKNNSDEDSYLEDDVSVGCDDTDVRTYYLFARTGREKEEWYSRFRAAANFMKDWQHDNPSPGVSFDRKYTTFKEMEIKFKNFMEDYHQAKNAEEAREKMSEASAEHGDENDEKTLSKKNIVKEQLAFINMFGARMWFDLHKSQVFIDFLRQKITRKLLKIKIAQYFEEVSVTTLDLGKKLPQILNASLPWQNEHGLWVDLDLEYHGVCEATVETKGIRLPTKDEPEKEEKESRNQGSLIDSDEADSAEEDDDIPDNLNNYLEGADIFMDDKGGGSSGPVCPGRDGLRSRMFESILKSSVVARMAESEWVKKNITGKNITLKLQLQSLKGTLILNFPPPPSDRIWYGFRSPPKLDITLKPYFGGKNLSKLEGTFSTIMRLLEKRLKQEFMKVLVYPNMDDEVFDFMDHVPYSISKSI